MDKVVQPYDKECMKMAILKHEETFKEQVYELHRLYQIQKMLMKNMPKTQKPQKQDFDLEQPAVEEFDNRYGNGGLEIVDEGEIELTLGPTSYDRASRRKPVSTTPLNSDSVPSFSSSSTGSSSHVKRVTREKASFLSDDREKQMRPPWLYQVLSLNMT